jgi:hypothetical protein
MALFCFERNPKKSMSPKRETPRAAQAFADYLAMGPGRSLEKLLAQYRQQTANGIRVPTLRFKTLADWSGTFCWQARLDQIVSQERQAVVSRGIVDKQNRLNALNDRWERLQKVIAERERQHVSIDSLQPSPAAGASTGLMVLTVRFLPGGGRVEEWAVDTSTLKEIREHEKQAAQEMGEWTEKREMTGKDGGPLEVKVEDARQQLTARLAAIATRRREGGGSSQSDDQRSGEAAL